MRRGLLIILILSILPLTLRGQEIVLSGTVTYRSNGQAVDLANVVVEDPASETVIGFKTTAADGRFTLSVSTKSAAVRLTVSGFNVARESYTVEARSQDLHLEVDYVEMDIREAVIKTRPIRQHKDTTAYYVAQFSDSLDRSISDVLRKLPGISVDESGGIRYQGKKIDNFYIEGMDLMGSRYGVATNNVRAQDVAVVEIYENHQPVKLLQSLVGASGGGQVALNLKLKETAKGALAGTAEIGTGLPVFLWDAGAVGMYFSRNYQMLGSFRSNDSGRDILSELKDQGSDSRMLTPYIHIYLPSTPQIDESRYRDNTTHAGSVNQLFKLTDDRILSLNGVYQYDRQRFSGNSLTRYYLPGENPLEVDESICVSRKQQAADVRVKYTDNGDRKYVEETLNLHSGWNDNEGTVAMHDRSVEQRLRGDFDFSLRNRFQLVHPLGDKNTLSWNSVIQIENLPLSLYVKPQLFPSLFDSGRTEGSLQEMGSRSIHVRNTLSTIVSLTNRLNLSVTGGYSLLRQQSDGTLCPIPGAGAPADSLRNDLHVTRHGIHTDLLLAYRYKGVKAFAGLDAEMTFLRLDDRIRLQQTERNRLLLHPFFSMELPVAHNQKLALNSSVQGVIGPYSDHYSGYVMTDYRHVSRRDAVLGESREQRHTIEWKTSDVLTSRFTALSLQYWHNHSNLMYDTSFDGFTSRIESRTCDNVSQGWDAHGRYARYIHPIRSTLEITGAYGQFRMNVMRESIVMPTRTQTLAAGMRIAANPGRRLKLEYDADASRYRSLFSGESEQREVVFAFRQRLMLEGMLGSMFKTRLSGDHCYNSSVRSDTRHICFADVSITWSKGRVEWTLEGHNLLGVKTYAWIVNTEAIDCESYYPLRPRTVMLTLRLNK